MFSASLTSNTIIPKAQFKGIIFCGYGSDLFPLIINNSELDEEQKGEEKLLNLDSTSSKGKLGQIKALLPLSGKPIIDFILDKLEEAGIYDVLIVSPISISSPLASHLRSRRIAATSSLVKIELETVTDELASQAGNIGVLKNILERGLVKTDFILLPCDLLLAPSLTTTLSLAALLDKHRTNNNLITTLFSEREAGNVLPTKKEDGPVEILTIFDETSKRLLDLREMDEFDEDEVPLRMSLLKAYPSPTLTTKLLPTQITIFAFPTIKLLLDPVHQKRLKNYDSITALIGWIARLHWRGKGVGEIDFNNSNGLTRSTTQFPFATSANSSEDLDETEIDLTEKERERKLEWERGNNVAPSRQLSSVNLHALQGNGIGGPEKRNVKDNPSGRCEIVIWKKSDGFCGRGNSIAGYVELNRSAVKLVPPTATPTSTPAGVFISPDCFLHPSVYSGLSEKVGIKRTIIGKGCKIGKGSKITNSVIMEGCTIGEGVKMDGCVLSNGVTIGDSCTLKDCEFGRSYMVEIDTNAKGEQLVLDE